MKPFILTVVLTWLLVCSNLGDILAQVPGGFTFESLNRTYTVYIPSSYTTGDDLPLLLALHGLTQTGNIMMQFSDFNTYAEQSHRSGDRQFARFGARRIHRANVYLGTM